MRNFEKKFSICFEVLQYYLVSNDHIQLRQFQLTRQKQHLTFSVIGVGNPKYVLINNSRSIGYSIGEKNHHRQMCDCVYDSLCYISCENLEKNFNYALLEWSREQNKPLLHMACKSLHILLSSKKNLKTLIVWLSNENVRIRSHSSIFASRETNPSGGDEHNLLVLNRWEWCYVTSF